MAGVAVGAALGEEAGVDEGAVVGVSVAVASGVAVVAAAVGVSASGGWVGIAVSATGCVLQAASKMTGARKHNQDFILASNKKRL